MFRVLTDKIIGVKLVQNNPLIFNGNQKRPKGLFDFYGGGTWTRTKDTACIRRML